MIVPVHPVPAFHSSLPQSSEAIREFPKIRGTLSWGPYNKDPTISGTIFGVPYFRKLPITQTGTTPKALKPLKPHTDSYVLLTWKPHSGPKGTVLSEDMNAMKLIELITATNIKKSRPQRDGACGFVFGIQGLFPKSKG